MFKYKKKQISFSLKSQPTIYLLKCAHAKHNNYWRQKVRWFEWNHPPYALVVSTVWGRMQAGRSMSWMRVWLFIASLWVCSISHLWLKRQSLSFLLLPQCYHLLPCLPNVMDTYPSGTISQNKLPLFFELSLGMVFYHSKQKNNQHKETPENWPPGSLECLDVLSLSRKYFHARNGFMQGHLDLYLTNHLINLKFHCEFQKASNQKHFLKAQYKGKRW